MERNNQHEREIKKVRSTYHTSSARPTKPIPAYPNAILPSPISYSSCVNNPRTLEDRPAIGHERRRHPPRAGASMSRHPHATRKGKTQPAIVLSFHCLVLHWPCLLIHSWCLLYVRGARRAADWMGGGTRRRMGGGKSGAAEPGPRFGMVRGSGGGRPAASRDRLRVIER
jgi:hypothetical protein